MLLPADPSRRAAVSATLRSTDHLFAVGSEVARRAMGLGADASRVSVFIQGVNGDHFGPGNRLEARRQLGIPATGPLLLWVGNMVEVKAAERVILAARGLSDTFPDLRVAMVGRGPREAALKTLAADSGTLADRIIFPGPIASEALPAWYHAANVMVLPSRSEGVPNVLLEAMATGLPFVASHVGGIPDLLPFGTSRTVAEGDADALALAVRNVLDEEAAGTTTAKRYDILDGARDIMRHLHLDRP
jgi:glycosyltransferase involved in cell wall biosynthesis